MPYVRTHGNQLSIVHGEREPGTGKVGQRVLFTIYSKDEALEILGRGGPEGDARFQALLEDQFSDIRFDWKRIRRGIEQNLQALPEHYEHRSDRLRGRFRQDLCNFTRQLLLTDPQQLQSAARVIQEHRHELEYLVDLIQWRLELRDQEPTQWNADNAFQWRFTLQGDEVPPETEEQIAGLYERREYEKAKPILRLLIDCFDHYAEGYNYLGLIAHDERRLEEAIGYFEKTIEVGRRLFPKRIAKDRYWSDLATRPYMRGLGNLAMALNEVGRYKDALALCDRLAKECGDEFTAAAHKTDIFLNTGQWQSALETSRAGGGEVNPSAGFTEGFAQFALGFPEESLAAFLHAALRYPLAARILVGAPSPAPKSQWEAEDHNLGIALRRNLHAYLKKQRPAAREFFLRLVRDPRVSHLLDESLATAKRWRAQRHPTDRTDFDRLQLLRSRAFARSEAHKLRDLVVTKPRERKATVQ
jgi:tetratricopeptide (TPR) repeat protein